MFFQIFGSILILIAFLFSQLGLLSASSKVYLIINAIGSTILALDAFHLQQWGFVLLEGIWALVSFVSLFNKLTKK